METEEIKICCLCKKEYIGHGNNAQPLKSGRCCDLCNSSRVIPARMKILRKQNNEK